MIRQATLSLATAGAAALLAAALAPSAEASAPPLLPVVHSAHIFNNYDNGAHGPWASLDYTRTAKITWAGPGKWNVALTDAGKFRTLQGHHSPGAGSAITSAQDGTFKGSFDFKVTSATPPSTASVSHAYNYHCNMNGSGNRATDCPGMPKSTDQWPTLFFPAGAVTAGNWSWQFNTCREQWTTKTTGDSGDITGKSCSNNDHGHGDNDHGDSHGNDHGNQHGNDHGDHGHQPHVTKVHVRAPYFKPATCRTSAYVKVSPVRGVQWYVNYHRANTITKVNSGDVTVSAKPLRGYDVIGTDSWKRRMHKPYCRPEHRSDNHH